MYTVVGIDPSLTGTGVVAISDGKPHVQTRIESKEKGVKRLIEIETVMQGILDTLISVDLVCLEGYAYAAHNQAHQVGELGGVLRRRLHKDGVRWIEIAPSQVKKFATGKGNAKKEQILLQVYKKWGVEMASNDIADAFVIAKIGEALLGGGDKLTQYQAEVVDELRKKYQEVLA